MKREIRGFEISLTPLQVEVCFNVLAKIIGCHDANEFCDYYDLLPVESGVVRKIAKKIKEYEIQNYIEKEIEQ